MQSSASQWVVVHLLVPEAEGHDLVRTMGAHRAALSSLEGAASAVQGVVERFGRVVVNPAARLVRRDGAPVALTPKMLDLLLALMRRRGAAASRAELLADVWNGREGLGHRTVDTHVMELRKRLEDDPASPRHILTVSKIGYRFEP